MSDIKTLIRECMEGLAKISPWPWKVVEVGRKKELADSDEMRWFTTLGDEEVVFIAAAPERIQALIDALVEEKTQRIAYQWRHERYDCMHMAFSKVIEQARIAARRELGMEP